MFFVSKFIPIEGGFHEVRYGRMTKNLTTAKRMAKRIKGIVRDDQRCIVAQAVFSTLEGNYIK